LAQFWSALGQAIPWDATGMVTRDGERLTAAGRLMLLWATMLSPSRSNPMRIDLLRTLLGQQVDFAGLRDKGAVRLFIAATHANSGRLRVFSNDVLSIDAVMASACLPTLHQAVVIDGEPYWDGGYSANPALFPLVHECDANDLLLVMLSPWVFGTVPQDAEDIRARATDIAFSTGFLREMQGLAHATRLARSAWWPAPHERRLRKLRWHLIDGHDALSVLHGDSKMIAHPTLLERLRDAGRERTRRWLADHGGAIGRRATADLDPLFGNHRTP
jgi:NTE family protein